MHRSCQSIYKLQKSNQVIIAVDSNDDDFHICPSKFGENEIKLLAISYNTEIEKEDRKNINIIKWIPCICTL